MNDPEVGRALAGRFPRVPSPGDIPSPTAAWYGGTRIEWDLGDGLVIRTSPGTMRRVWATATDRDGHQASAHASTHVAAVRALIRWAIRFYGEEQENE